MKYITNTLNIDNLTDIFPVLKQYKDSNQVYICRYRAPSSYKITLYNYDIIIMSMFGDYGLEIFDEIRNLANIRKDRSQHIIVPSTIDLPPGFEMPDNVHWLPFKSMYAIFVKDLEWIEQARPHPIKKFVSMNQRFNWFRQELFYYFYQQGLLDSSYFSYAGFDKFNNGEENNFAFAENIIGANRYTDIDKQQIFKMLPYKNFDESIVRYNGMTGEQLKSWSFMQELYNKSAVGIETETYMETFLDYNPGLTEKTIRPLVFGNPFLVYSNRGALKTLHDMGFKTFPNIIDESYDDILSPQLRFEAILTEIKKLNEIDSGEIVTAVKDTVDYNQDLILTTWANQLKQDSETLDNLIRSLL